MSGHRPLSSQRAIGRFGVAYVRKVCAHAHVGFTETSADEDVLAIDGKIEFDRADVRIQIKASTTYSLAKLTGSIALPIQEGWRDKWRANIHPAYLVLVLMDKSEQAWVQYAETSTLVGAYALWARVDTLDADAEHVQLDRADRFTPDTLKAWFDTLVGGYGQEVESS